MDSSGGARMSKAGEHVNITVNGRRVGALRIWLRPGPGATPGGLPTIPPREYRQAPADLEVEIGDKLHDEEEECDVVVTYIRRPRKTGGQVRELTLRCE